MLCKAKRMGTEQFSIVNYTCGAGTIKVIKSPRKEEQGMTMNLATSPYAELTPINRYCRLPLIKLGWVLEEGDYFSRGKWAGCRIETTSKGMAPYFYWLYRKTDCVFSPELKRKLFETLKQHYWK